MERALPGNNPEQVLLAQLRNSAGSVIYAHEVATGRMVAGVSHGLRGERVWIKSDDGELDSYPLEGWQYITEPEKYDRYESI